MPRPSVDSSAIRAEIVELLRNYGIESHRVAEVFAEAHGVHHTDLRALVAVLHAEQRGEPLTPGQLAATVGLSSGATTALIDRLEVTGHLRRVRDDPDRRRVRLHYDPAGMALARGFFGPLGERSNEVMDRFTVEELATVARFLGAMNATLTRHRQLLDDKAATGFAGEE